MSKEYFLAYHSYLEPIKNLSEAEMGRLFLAALEYSASGKLMELKGNEKFAFAFIKQQIDRDSQKYVEKCSKNQANGIYGELGGRPKKPLGISKTQVGFSKPLEKEKEKEKEKKKKNITPLSTNVDIPPLGKCADNVDVLFEQFWSAYPKKVAKQAAFKTFRNIPKIEATLDKILAGVEKWENSGQWQDPQFIPYPATFLNQKRWEDEIPKGGAANGNYQRNFSKKLCNEYPE